MAEEGLENQRKDNLLNTGEKTGFRRRKIRN